MAQAESNQLKPALTFEQQVERLKQKGMVIKSEDNTLRILKKENYYRISGYGLEFLDTDDSNKYKHGTTFEDIYNLYKADKELRSILFELINDTEVYLKTQVSNYFSLKYGPEGYRCTTNFRSQENADNMIEKCNDIVAKKPNNLIIKHHKNRYNSVLPLWAMVEMMSFGWISKFFKNLKTKDKKAICRLAFNDMTYEKLESMIHSAVYFRNECCHYTRLYNILHTIQPMEYTPKGILIPAYKTRSTFSFVIILFYLNPNKKLGERAIAKLKVLQQDSDFSFIEKYGFVENWKKILYDANGHCIKYGD